MGSHCASYFSLSFVIFDYFWPALTHSESNHSTLGQGCIWSKTIYSICMKLLQYCIRTEIFYFFSQTLVLILKYSEGSLSNCFILFNSVCTNVDISLQYLYILALKMSLVHFAKRLRNTVLTMLKLICR